MNSPAPSLSHESLITAQTLCDLAGGISRMTLWRWLRAGIVPAPIVIRGRRYWPRNTTMTALMSTDCGGASHE